MTDEPTVLESGPTRRGGVTLQDVARHLGVHPMTVSRALSGSGRIAEATRDNVRRAAAELGYRPNLMARSLRQGRSQQMVALFAPLLDSGMTTQKLERIQSLLSAQGLEAPIHSCGFHAQNDVLQAAMLANLRTQRPAAMVCCTLLLKPAALAELRGWIEDGGTAICYDHAIDLPCDRVVFDRENAGYQAARHLLELGHTRIGHASHSLIEGDECLAGVQRALREAGIEPQAEWNFSADEPIHSEVGGIQLAAQYLAMPPPRRPTGLCMVNELAALPFMAQLKTAGVRVPDNLSLVTHDDQPFAAYAAVPLTVVTQPVQTIARRVVDLLLSRLRGEAPDAPRQIVVPGQLIARQSTAPAR